MDVKFNIQDLAELFARKNNISRKEADLFVRTFFDTISTYLLREKIVKIKGFGTFKLVEVSDRESVDVNTGRRILIEGHSKVSFTPDNSLRDQVNKPFCDFETVVLNEGTDISDMERIDDPVIEPHISSDSDTGIDDDSDIENHKPLVVDTSLVSEPISVVEAGIDSDENENSYTKASLADNTNPEEVEVDLEEVLEEIDVQNVESHNEAEIPSQTSDENEPFIENANTESQFNLTAACSEERKETNEVVSTSNSECAISEDITNRPKYVSLAKYVFILLLIIASYFIGYYRILCPCSFTPIIDRIANDDTVANIAVETDDSQPVLVEDTATNIPDSAVVAGNTNDNVQTEAESLTHDKSADIEQYPQIPGGKYLIVGTRGVHVMKRGDNLYKIARSNYGHNDFVKYIIVYNQFKNPDVIPPGYSIKLPELEEVK